MLRDWCRVVLPVAACLGLASCATRLEVRALATGHGHLAAYELSGGDLAALRREAQRLCPQGGEILRQASQDQSPEQIGGPVRDWMNRAAAWADPPQRSAQMMVLCHQESSRNHLQAVASTTDAASSPAGVAQGHVDVGAPIGPLSVEW